CVILVVGALICVYGIIEDRHEREQAEQLLTVLRQIHVGSMDRSTVVQVTHPFSRYVDEVPVGQQIRFVFYNRWLRRLRLAPHTEFRVTIAFDDEVVTDKRAYEIVSTTGCAAEVVEKKRGSGTPSGFPLPPSHRVLFWPSASAGNVTRIRIENDDTYGEK